MKSISRGFGWTLLTTASGLFGLLAYWAQSLVNKGVEFNKNAILSNGSLLLFSATLAAAVAVDSLFQRDLSRSQRDKLPGLYLGSVSVVLFSLLFYPHLLSTPEQDIEIANIYPITGLTLFSSIMVAIVGKSITLGRHGEEQ